VAYRLKSERPVAAELTRVARKQLKRASSELTAAGARLRREKVHAARKRVKKVRALLRLAAPHLPKRTWQKTNARLQAVSRRLGRIADAGAAAAALNRLAQRHPRTIPKRAATLLQDVLHQREIAIRRAARKKHVSAKCDRVLLGEARRTKRWAVDPTTAAALTPAIERSARRARKAMKIAWRHPDADRLHAWRRRVKGEWLQMRLAESNSTARLDKRRRELEELDGVLGQSHDLALLRRALEEEDPLTTRELTAAVLRLIARERRKLRRRAHVLGREIYGETAA
jgi:CHAD domain-containing protein